MTIKQLIPKLIARYEKCINEMPEVGWRWYLIGNEAYSGVCSLSYNKFRKKLVNTKFMKEFTYGKMYLCKPTGYSESYSEAKELLQIRLNRLKEFL